MTLVSISLKIIYLKKLIKLSAVVTDPSHTDIRDVTEKGLVFISTSNHFPEFGKNRCKPCILSVLYLRIAFFGRIKLFSFFLLFYCLKINIPIE